MIALLRHELRVLGGSLRPGRGMYIPAIILGAVVIGCIETAGLVGGMLAAYVPVFLALRRQGPDVAFVWSLPVRRTRLYWTRLAFDAAILTLLATVVCLVRQDPGGSMSMPARISSLVLLGVVCLAPAAAMGSATGRDGAVTVAVAGIALAIVVPVLFACGVSGHLAVLGLAAIPGIFVPVVFSWIAAGREIQPDAHGRPSLLTMRWSLAREHPRISLRHWLWGSRNVNLVGLVVVTVLGTLMIGRFHLGWMNVFALWMALLLGSLYGFGGRKRFLLTLPVSRRRLFRLGAIPVVAAMAFFILAPLVVDGLTLVRSGGVHIAWPEEVTWKGRRYDDWPHVDVEDHELPPGRKSSYGDPTGGSFTPLPEDTPPEAAARIERLLHLRYGYRADPVEFTRRMAASRARARELEIESPGPPRHPYREATDGIERELRDEIARARWRRSVLESGLLLVLALLVLRLIVTGRKGLPFLGPLFLIMFAAFKLTALSRPGFRVFVAVCDLHARHFRAGNAVLLAAAILCLWWIRHAWTREEIPPGPPPPDAEQALE